MSLGHSFLSSLSFHLFRFWVQAKRVLQHLTPSPVSSQQQADATTPLSEEGEVLRREDVRKRREGRPLLFTWEKIEVVASGFDAPERLSHDEVAPVTADRAREGVLFFLDSLCDAKIAVVLAILRTSLCVSSCLSRWCRHVPDVPRY